MSIFLLWVFFFQQSLAWRIAQSTGRRSFCLRSSPEVNADVEAYLSGKARKWRGTWDILPRRKQVPLPEYSSKDVVMTILKALKNSDDPQLDHGPAVVLSFASPQGTLKESNLDPSDYGRFLRDPSHGYLALIDFKEAELLEETKLGETSRRQRVCVRGWGSLGGDSAYQLFDFFLSKPTDTWLVDVILASK
jgi:hypothetical protein